MAAITVIDQTAAASNPAPSANITTVAPVSAVSDGAATAALGEACDCVNHARKVTRQATVTGWLMMALLVLMTIFFFQRVRAGA